MERTWRWFGKKDKITLAQLRQIGVEGIVTALHDVPLGEVWTREKIRDLREYIESYGMRWSVVESLPVVETIKYGGPDRDQQIEVYKQSLRNLSAEGIHCICYNFMPVLDWARTDLLHTNPNGSTNLYFNYAEFAYFDIYILKREGAREEWAQFQFPAGIGEGRNVLAECDELAKTMTPDKDHKLVENIVIKTQGFVSGNFSENDEAPVQKFREFLDLYKGIDKKQLRENMKYFLEAIMPVCEECDMNMCVHPDDPPIDRAHRRGYPVVPRRRAQQAQRSHLLRRQPLGRCRQQCRGDGPQVRFAHPLRTPALLPHLPQRRLHRSLPPGRTCRPHRALPHL